MKKIFTLILLFATIFVANAQEYTALDKSQDNILYVEAKLQKDAKGFLEVYMKSSTEPIGAIDFQFFMPDGVTLDTGDTPDATTFEGIMAAGVAGVYTIFPQSDGSYKNAINSMNFVSSDAKLIAKIPVIVTADCGEYNINAIQYQMTWKNDATQSYKYNDVYTTLTVQKAAILEPQDNDFAFDILPAQISSATTSLPILMKNKLDVASYTLEVTYPAGITPKSGRGVAPVVDASNLYSTTDPSVQALSVTQTVSGQVATYKVSNAQLDTYMAKDEYYEVLNVPVTVSNTDAICNIKVMVSDIVAYDAENDVALVNPINVKGGEFMTTLVIGQPSVQEAILYGNYTSDAVSAFTTALKNVAIADVTAATVDDGVKFEDVLVNKKGGYSYYTRTSANYGTTVLPFDLTTYNVTELYTIKSMDAKSIVLEEAPIVPANTPCIFKGIINVKGLTPTFGELSELNLGQTTFKGTYQSMNLGAGDGYYISSNGKFYNDGATVRPFRGYFEGTVSGAKALQVLLEDETGIKDITDQFSTEEIYNLMGVKMNNAKKGVNIINGKKVYIK